MKKRLVLLTILVCFVRPAFYAQDDISWVRHECDGLYEGLFSAFYTDGLCYGVVDTCEHFVTVIRNVIEACDGKYSDKDSIVVPAKVVYDSVEYTVVAVHFYAFTDCRDLEVLILPSTILRIDGFAFNGCRKLRRLVLGPNLVYVSPAAFGDCERLKKVVLPKNCRIPDLCRLKIYVLPEFVDEAGKPIQCPDDK